MVTMVLLLSSCILLILPIINYFNELVIALVGLINIQIVYILIFTPFYLLIYWQLLLVFYLVQSMFFQKILLIVEGNSEKGSFTVIYYSTIWCLSLRMRSALFNDVNNKI
jgi:hypothetical protein